MKRIGVVTGTRAEYGLLKPLIDQINGSEDFNLQIFVTGSHLSPEFGLTYQQIEVDGYRNLEKVEMLLSSDTSTGVVKSMGLAMIGFADAFNRNPLDLLIILGDRYEMLAVASVATIFKIPIAHLHGGEITEGAYDDAIRHAITKLSSLHFTSTEEYRKRVIQMGEHPSTVFDVGAIGLDNIKELTLLSRSEIEQRFGFKFKENNFLITFHPETMGGMASEAQFQILLKALDEIDEEKLLIFTKANADTDGRVINQLIDSYVSKHPDNSVAFTSMGQVGYLSTMKYATAIVGNSSSGIIEAPSFNVPTINIGDRQKGRIQADSVLNCEIELDALKQAFEKIRSFDFQKSIKNFKNPYDKGGASDRILQILKSANFKEIQAQTFYDL